MKLKNQDKIDELLKLVKGISDSGFTFYLELDGGDGMTLNVPVIGPALDFYDLILVPWYDKIGEGWTMSDPMELSKQDWVDLYYEMTKDEKNKDKKD